MTMLDACLSLLSIPLLTAALYMALLAVASIGGQRVSATTPQLRFTFLVPAHNEAAGLPRTLQSLARVHWPSSLFRVHVVADNCTDATARIARDAGVVVTERQDAANRGKGHALRVGVETCLADPFSDALVVVDADTVVDANILVVMQAHLQRGAQVVQARYGVLNGGEGWRPRLMSLALALFHDVRSRGRHALGLSVGLRGNGMCFTRQVLIKVPLQSTSLVEDVEQGIILGRAGVVVHHARETRVMGEMPQSRDAAASQRFRWERGREQLRRTWLRLLSREAWQKKNAVLGDLALDLAIPPLTTLVLLAGAGWLAASLLAVLGGGFGALVLWSCVLLLLFVYVARGVQLSERGWRAWLDLGAAPFFVAWKVLALVRNRTMAPPAWVRTARTGEKP